VKTNSALKAFLNSHWMTFCFLIPFVILFGLHNALGLSAAMMVSADDHPGRDKVFGMDVQTYNMIMVAAYFLSIGGYFIHTWHIWDQSKNKNRTKIAIAKTSFLVFYWQTALFLIQYTLGR
jgi:hypothetical protein